MNRRLSISLRLAAVLLPAAFVVAVQRDTPIRRWLVPSPTAGADKLRLILPHFAMKQATSDEVIAELSRQTGVKIDRSGVPTTFNQGRFDIDLKNVAASEVLGFAIEVGLPQAQAIAIADGERVLIRPADLSDMPWVSRGYDLGDFLPPDGPPRTPPAPPTGSGSGIYAGSKQSDREEMMQRVAETLSGIVKQPSQNTFCANGRNQIRVPLHPVWVGDRLIVVAPEPVQKQVADAIYRFRQAGQVGWRDLPKPF